MSFSSNANFTLRRNIWIVESDAAVGQFYTFAAKATPWDNELMSPDLDNSVALNEYQIAQELLFGKFVPDTNLSLMTNRYDWVNGTVYDHYDDQDPELFTKQFFVSTSESGARHVFKCLNNNDGAPSTHKPLLAETSADDVFYKTSDGYQWKYMFSVNTSTYNKFVTPTYIPVSANSAVVGNAVSGAIETFKIESPGGNYNSVTNGYFTDIAIDGNLTYFGIQGSDTTVLKISPNTYNIGEKVSQVYSGVIANGVVSSESSSGGDTVLILKNVNGVFSTGANVITGVTSGKSSTVLDVSSPTVSSNTNFYNGCSLYISAGTGAGQIKTIDNYIVVGNARRIIVDSAFTILPDLTSKYLISPAVVIQGDGSGAQAISVIDPTTKQLTDIQVINRGSGYHYANVSFVGNTGSTSIVANNAVVRAILPPRGGHGFDPASELAATYLAYSSTFTGDEGGKIPGDGSTYRRVGILTNPLYANVSLTYSYSTLPTFPTLDGTVVHGSISNAYGLVAGIDAGANTVRLSNVSGIFKSNDILTASYANGQIAVDASANVVLQTVTGQSNVFDNRTLLVCPSSTLTGGSFAINEKIVQTSAGLDTGYGIIQDIETVGSNTNIYLTEVKGLFQGSDTPTNSYKYIYDDATRQKSIQINDVVNSDLVPYTGEILYVENIEPVTRDISQSETVKLIVGFN